MYAWQEECLSVFLVASQPLHTFNHYNLIFTQRITFQKHNFNALFTLSEIGLLIIENFLISCQ